MLTKHVEAPWVFPPRAAAAASIITPDFTLGASPTEPDNSASAFPRRGIGFAYPIGYRETEVTNPRGCVLSSLEVSDDGTQTWQVALTKGGGWKLICSSGGAGLSDMSEDEFYNLYGDPTEENNLISDMSVEQMTVYLEMRDKIVDEWLTASHLVVAEAPVCNK